MYLLRNGHHYISALIDFFLVGPEIRLFVRETNDVIVCYWPIMEVMFTAFRDCNYISPQLVPESPKQSYLLSLTIHLYNSWTTA